MRWAEQSYTNRNDVHNDAYAQRYLDHYAKGTPMMDAEDAARLVGVDLTDRAFWRDGLDMIKKDVERLDALFTEE